MLLILVEELISIGQGNDGSSRMGKSQNEQAQVELLKLTREVQANTGSNHQDDRCHEYPLSSNLISDVTHRHKGGSNNDSNEV